jgi:hypothetical protein
LDPLLLPFLESRNDVDESCQTSALITGYAAPIARKIIAFKLRAGRWIQSSDGDDLWSSVALALLGRLRQCKADPSGSAIDNFQGYVAVAAYHACDEYFRARFPRRHSLKNKLRYLFRHDAELAVWENPGGETICGMVRWKDAAPATAGARARSLARDPGMFAREDSSGHGEERAQEWTKALLRWAGEPLPLDDIVSAAAYSWGVHDREVSLDATGEELPGPPDPESGDRLLLKLDWRWELRSLWAEILELPLRQRQALLLNLRDGEGGAALDLLLVSGTAGMRDLADAVAIGLQDFLRLWNSLPWEDSRLAEWLGTTRQQVINLRRSARERLGRKRNELRKGSPA